MPEETVQLRSAATQPDETAAGVPPELGDRAGLRVQQLALDRTVAQLLRIEVRGVRRQPLELIIGLVPGQELLHGLGLVRTEPVPHDDQRPPNPLPEVAQRGDHLLPVDTPDEMPRIQARGAVQRCDQRPQTRHLPPLAQPSQDGRLARRGPGSADAGPKRVPRLIQEGDRTPVAASPLFIRGQSRRSQAAIRASSRSRARGKGRWGLHPRACKARLRERKWYRTPKVPSMTWAIRRSVQRSVSNPAARAPRWSRVNSWPHCAGVSRAGRPADRRCWSPRSPA